MSQNYREPETDILKSETVPKKKKSLSFTEYWAVLTMKNDDDEAAERKCRHDKSS